MAVERRDSTVHAQEDSITEHADDSPTSKLMEAIIESVDEFYSENLIPVIQSREHPRLALPA